MFVPLLLVSSILAADAARIAPATAPVLWSEPRHATAADWVWGPGGEAKAPRPPFRFVRENLGGTNPKVDVRDASGALWIVKFGAEVHTDTFAARFLNAVGYLSEPTYFVPSGVIEGTHGLKRARSFVARDGSFRQARFRLHDSQTLAYADEIRWSWTENPFLGSHELAGLQIVMMLLSNWDAKDSRDGGGSNTAVFRNPASGQPRYYYAFNDWGASLGRCGRLATRDRWDAAEYARQTPRFVMRLDSGSISWGFSGKHAQDIKAGISLDDIRWLSERLQGISRHDLWLGLLASGATQADAAHFAESIDTRIHQLRVIAGAAQGDSQ